MQSNVNNFLSNKAVSTSSVNVAKQRKLKHTKHVNYVIDDKRHKH